MDSFKRRMASYQRVHHTAPSTHRKTDAVTRWKPETNPPT